jgi:hypothetical protein
MFTKRFSLIFVIVVLLAGITTPALAKKPDRYSFEIDQVFPIADCGEFDVLVEGTLFVDSTVFYDEDGNFVREKWDVTTDDRYYSPQTGKEARDSVTFNTFWFENWEVKTVGLSLKLTIPGEGTLLINAGHLKWDAAGNIVFVKGNYGKEDYDKFCAWFAE